MFAIGAFLKYDETVFDYYLKFTDSSRESVLLSTKLNYELMRLPLYEELAHPRNESTWLRVNSFNSYTKDKDSNDLEMGKGFTSEGDLELLSHVLAKPGGIFVKPVSFFSPEKKELITFIHLGYRLSGYPFLVHGGILATILNEVFKLTSTLGNGVDQFQRNINVKHLSINYKSPCIANNFLTIRTKIKDESTNGFVLEGTIESQERKVHILSEATTENFSSKGLSWLNWFAFL